MTIQTEHVSKLLGDRVNSLCRCRTHEAWNSRFYNRPSRRSGCTLRTRHKLDISSLSVAGMRYATVPVAEPFGQNLEVVAMHVHGVGTGVIAFDDHAYACITAEIEHIPFLITP